MVGDRLARELREDAATLRTMAEALDARATAREAELTPAGVPERYKYDLSIDAWYAVLEARTDAERDAIAREAARREAIFVAVEA